ncbi:hypothetical protein LSTR_LSTR000386 [Laodelphax striatellus]|uniref:Tectonic-1-3 N-terminal domain-containing protein n=1 Tax=Laodelphax striatellus TaxID=195883 RepID=A0A482X3X8_LAOST|nr:hypothetical protein LSTR_LSTR000386 [Laodelphax striatellus]
MYSFIYKILFLIISMLLNSVLHSHGFLPMLQEKTRNSLNAKGSSYYPHWYIQSDDSDNTDTCDLTANFCDTNCCSDKECKKYQKEMFECPKKSTKEVFSQEQVDFECNYKSSEKRPWWLFFLCYVRNNSPFHVKFFEEDDVIKTLDNIKEKLGETAQNKNKIRNYPHSGMESFLREGYLNDNPIFLKNTNGGNKEQFFLLFPTNVLNSMHCANIPLKYLEQNNAECLRLFSKELCLEENRELSLNDYLIRNKSSGLLQKVSINIPKTIISFQENFQFSDIFHKIDCTMNDKRYLVASKYSKGEFPLGNSDESNNSTRSYNKSCDIENVRFMIFNKEKSLCENVLVGSRMKIIWNGTLISKIHISYHLADIPFPNTDHNTDEKFPKSTGNSENSQQNIDDNLRNRSNHSESERRLLDARKSVYNKRVTNYFVKQTFSVEYQHVHMNDSNSMHKNHSRDSNATGYLIGEDIAPYIERIQNDPDLDHSEENGTAGETFGLWKRGEPKLITL